jgi:ElaB/YqjD/DUF883 family membrane-anchored ribosome-binding protein
MERDELQNMREMMERDLQNFTRNAKNLIKTACGEEDKGCKEWAHDQLEYLRRQYQDFGQKIRPGMDRTQMAIKDSVDRTQTMIKEHPYWTAGALAGAGLAAISFLIATKKKG